MSPDESEEAAFDVEMDADEFVRHLHEFEEVVEKMDGLRTTVENLESSGLDRDDLNDLLYGKGVATRTELAAFKDAMREAKTMRNRELAVRLLSDLSSEPLGDTEEFVEEMQRLNKKYGDL